MYSLVAGENVEKEVGSYCFRRSWAWFGLEGPQVENSLLAPRSTECAGDDATALTREEKSGQGRIPQPRRAKLPIAPSRNTLQDLEDDRLCSSTVCLIETRLGGVLLAKSAAFRHFEVAFDCLSRIQQILGHDPFDVKF